MKKYPGYPKFRGFLAENKIRLKEVAKVTGVTASRISLKNNGYADYSMSEINMICNTFGCDPSVFRATDSEEGITIKNPSAVWIDKGEAVVELTENAAEALFKKLKNKFEK